MTVRGRIYRSTSHCNRYNGHDGPELPTRDPSDEGELYMTQNTIAPLGPFPALSRKPPLRLPPTARTNANTPEIPPDAHCRSACRSSFARRASSISPAKSRTDREVPRGRLGPLLPGQVNGQRLHFHLTRRSSTSSRCVRSEQASKSAKCSIPIGYVGKSVDGDKCMDI